MRIQVSKTEIFMTIVDNNRFSLCVNYPLVQTCLCAVLSPCEVLYACSNLTATQF